jgi:hypothetical protein
MLAKELLSKLGTALNDAGHVRWSVATLLEYITDAQRYTVLLRPDAYSKVEAVQLAANSTRQTIPAGAVRFLGVVRNMGLDGQTPGLPVTLTQRDALDEANSGWHTEGGSLVIDHYVFNEDTPAVYYVTPPPAAGVHVELEYAASPATLASEDDLLALDDTWSEPLREYVLYLCYTNNATDSQERSRAEWHLQKYYLALGEEKKAKIIYSPNAEVRGNG